MYRLDRMRKQYEQFTAAEGYIIGFHIGDDVYMVRFDKIPRKYTLVQKESHSCGGGYGLYVKISSFHSKIELIDKAVKIGTIKDLESNKYNKGVMFERLIYKINGQELREKDSIPFYKKGDININGKEIQIKYEHARICYDRTLQRLVKGEVKQ